MWCKKGFAKYYGLSRVDDSSLESLNNYLLNNGWQPFGESGSLDNLKHAVLNLNDRVGSVYFKNQDDLTAMLSVARTDMRRNGSLCISTLCQLAETKKKNYAAIAEISIFYETRPF